jgi:probable O-glycosylation ligase (exosortase A-associated)
MIFFGLLLVFFVEYIRPGNLVPVLNVTRPNTIIPLAVLIGTFVTGSRWSAGDLMKELNTRLLLVFLGLVTASFLVAEVTLYAYTVFTTVFGYVMLYWVIVRQVTDLSRVKWLFRTVVFLHVLLAALTPEMFTNPGGRHYINAGTFVGDGNDYALSVNVALPMCLFLLLDARTWKSRILYALTLLLLVSCVVLTQSRGGTLALIAIGVYYWAKSERKLVTGLLAAVALVGVMTMAPPQYFDRMNTISQYEDNSAQARLGAWKAAIGMAASNPVMGAGAGQFPSNYTRFANKDGGRWMTAHSIYFLMLGELGIPGITVLLSIIIMNLVANGRVARRARSALPDTGSLERSLLASLSASLIGFAVAGAFLSVLYYPHIFYLCGLLTCARRIVGDRLAAHRTEAPPVAPRLRPPVAMSPVIRGRYAS